jgi:2'-5' RNA ligase
LSALVAALEPSVVAIGVPTEERPFAAHVTLGRVRNGRGLGRLVERLQQTAWTPPPAFRVEHVTLFESRLSSAGPTYTPLLRAPLVA